MPRELAKTALESFFGGSHSSAFTISPARAGFPQIEIIRLINTDFRRQIQGIEPEVLYLNCLTDETRSININSCRCVWLPPKHPAQNERPIHVPTRTRLNPEVL